MIQPGSVVCVRNEECRSLFLFEATEYGPDGTPVAFGGTDQDVDVGEPMLLLELHYREPKTGAEIAWCGKVLTANGIVGWFLFEGFAPSTTNDLFWVWMELYACT